jgi:hypothetical protein
MDFAIRGNTFHQFIFLFRNDLIYPFSTIGTYSDRISEVSDYDAGLCACQ